MWREPSLFWSRNVNPWSAPVAIVDTGLASGIRNAAIDRAWLELRANGHGSDVLRLHRSHPTASVGRQQALDRELRLDYCLQHSIEVVRRASSGGALYLDPDQLGFSLVMRRPAAWRKLALAQLLELGSAAVAAGLAQLGIAATFKPPNDIEVGGRKIASVFAACRNDAVLLHGSVLLDADIETMLKALRIPTEKLSPDGLAAARERLTAVNVCRVGPLPPAAVMAALTRGIAERLELNLRAGDNATPIDTPAPEQIAAEQALAQSIRWDDSIGSRLEALIRTAGGTLRARADFASLGTRLCGVEFATDAHVEPADFFPGLQRALEGLPLEQISARVASFAQHHALDAAGCGVTDIEQLLMQLADKRRFAQRSGLGASQANALMPYAGAAGLDSTAVLGKASVMLVPYCAKPAWCQWRQRDDCTECGLCEVGTAYALARERNLQVTTITNYEHLVATLAQMKAQRVEAYVGMCCSNFFIKRYRAFAEAGVPALLMDISGANCYELQQEDEAYAGTFQAEARLDAEILTQVMKFVPRRVPARSENQ